MKLYSKERKKLLCFFFFNWNHLFLILLWMFSIRVFVHLLDNWSQWKEKYSDLLSACSLICFASNSWSLDMYYGQKLSEFILLGEDIGTDLWTHLYYMKNMCKGMCGFSYWTCYLCIRSAESEWMRFLDQIQARIITSAKVSSAGS